MASKYWRRVSEMVYQDDYYGDHSVFSFQCLNCKVEWECDKSPEAFRLCPFCEVRWKGEFTRRNVKHFVRERFEPSIEIELLKGRPHDSIKDVWHSYISVKLFKNKLAKYILSKDFDKTFNNRYDNVKAVRLVSVRKDGTKKVIWEKQK